MPNWIDKPTEIRPGEELNASVLKNCLIAQIPDLSGEIEINQFPGGYSNLTYLIRVGEKEFVLRRPPIGAAIKSGHDMDREYKILSQLHILFPKAPQAIYYSKDEAIMGSSFYVMERVKGVILRYSMPKEMYPIKEQMKQIASSWLDTMVELHSVDYEKAGLSDLGRPGGYNERQISGWTKRYFNAKTDEVPKLEKAATWLDKNIPIESGVSLIHNDFKYDNLVLDADDWTKVKAVLDWEMATLGDPLMDIGTSIGYWINHDDPDFMKQMQFNPTHIEGNPRRGEVLHNYCQRSGRQVDDGVFYYVYGLFKIAVIAQQIYSRYKKGLTRDERFASLIDGVKSIGIIADQAISRKKIDDIF